MAVTEPNLVIAPVLVACSSITLSDTTGIYPTATGGYGLSGGPAVNDVTTVTLRVTMNYLGASYFQYVFTTTNGVITAATLSLNGATPVNILTQLSSTVWPLVGFDLFGDYTVTLPKMTDDIYKIDYTIQGQVSAEDFTFLSTVYFPVLCNAIACKDVQFSKLDLTCDCSSGARDTALFLLALISRAQSDGEDGNLTPALNDLGQINRICDENCGCG